MKNVTLQGITAPVLTPFCENGEVNTDEYARLTNISQVVASKGFL